MQPQCESITGLCHIYQETKKAFIGLVCHVWEDHRKGLFTVTALATTFYVHRMIKRRRRSKKWDNAGKDMIILHGMNRTSMVPNLSPFAMKLETYLRVAGLKYEFDCEDVFGPKGKTPWITLNGQGYGDSQLIIEMLTSHFGKNINAHLSPAEAAISRAFLIMADDHAYWGGVWYRYVIEPKVRVMDTLGLSMLMKPIIKQLVKRRMRNRLMGHGMGVHTDVEIAGMIMKDIQAVSDFLGDKNYLLGDKPCEGDLAWFGILSQVLYAMPGSPATAFMQEGSRINLVHYCERIKKEYWPDWDTLTKAITQGK